MNVISDLGGHNKVAELHDTIGADNVDLFQYFATTHTSGTIEFYMRTTEAGNINRLYSYDSATQGFMIQIDSDKFQYVDGVGAWQDVGKAASDDTWYRIRIDFDCSTDTYDLYIDGSSEGTGLPFRNACTSISRLRWSTGGADSGYYLYVDAVGYSWNPNYSVGDIASAYSQVVYRQAKARRGSHESHKDFSAFDITKMIFPEVI